LLQNYDKLSYFCYVRTKLGSERLPSSMIGGLVILP
jgi:hypothetical protein